MSKSSYLDGLTGLRAFAALAVFGVHFNQTVRLEAELGPFDLARLLANGEHGVALFFALSGFLLALPLWQVLQAGGELPGFKGFAVRRVARIVPAYFVALTLLISLAGLWQFAPAHADIALHYLFLFNFTEFSIFSINAPFWTLAVEMQFYLLLPLVFLLLARLDGRWRLPVLVVMGGAAYALHYGLMEQVTHIIDWPFDPRLTWIRPYGAVLSHSLLAHLPHFLLGVVAARVFLQAGQGQRNRWLRSAWFNDALFLGAFLIVMLLMGTALQDAVQIPYGRYGLPLVPLLLVVLVVSAPRARVARAWLEARPVRALGQISYGFYIYHVPCLTWLDRWMAGYGIDAAEQWLMFGAGGLLLTVLLATLSYLLIERPALRIAHRIG